MRFGIVGLGRMGLSLGKLAVERGHEVVAWDPDDSAREQAEKAGMRAVDDLEDVPGELAAPRVTLMWVPHGKPVDQNLEHLPPALFEHWNHGAVSRSWLDEPMGKGLQDGGIGLSVDMPPDPRQMSTYAEDTDEVKWVVKWAIDHDIPVPVTVCRSRC